MFNYSKAFNGFSVSDVQKAKEFYNKKLGLNVIDNPMGVIELEVKGSANILVYPKPNHIPATYTVLNFVVDDIEEAVDSLFSAGVTFEQYEGQIKTDEKGICRNSGGPTLAWFKDPAGNILALIQEK